MWDALNVIYQTICKIWRFVAFFATPSSYGFSIVALLTSVFVIGRDLWDRLLVEMDKIAAMSFGGADFSPLSFANYFIPLSELLGMLVVWLGLFVLTHIIRIIKSFIPTVS